jgi:hypothetical protein
LKTALLLVLSAADSFVGHDDDDDDADEYVCWTSGSTTSTV